MDRRPRRFLSASEPPRVPLTVRNPTEPVESGESDEAAGAGEAAEATGVPEGLESIPSTFTAGLLGSTQLSDLTELTETEEPDEPVEAVAPNNVETQHDYQIAMSVAYQGMQERQLAAMRAIYLEEHTRVLESSGRQAAAPQAFTRPGAQQLGAHTGLRPNPTEAVTRNLSHARASTSVPAYPHVVVPPPAEQMPPSTPATSDNSSGSSTLDIEESEPSESTTDVATETGEREEEQDPFNIFGSPGAHGNTRRTTPSTPPNQAVPTSPSLTDSSPGSLRTQALRPYIMTTPTPRNARAPIEEADELSSGSDARLEPGSDHRPRALPPAVDDDSLQTPRSRTLIGCMLRVLERVSVSTVSRPLGREIIDMMDTLSAQEAIRFCYWLRNWDYDTRCQFDRDGDTGRWMIDLKVAYSEGSRYYHHLIYWDSNGMRV
ncbi:MAG: hypothetical protein M1825_003089 [Sarcosagium campestre]|nr:MAG: hypothetical protein M1825_003089 [Sarcosagium campestre]